MGRFLLGFIVGAAVSATAVLMLTPKSGPDTRQSLTAQLNDALEAGRKATAAREQELWNEFRQNLKDSQQPSPNNSPYRLPPTDY